MQRDREGKKGERKKHRHRRMQRSRNLHAEDGPEGTLDNDAHYEALFERTR